MDAVYLPMFHSFLKEIFKEIRVSKEIFLPLPILHSSTNPDISPRLWSSCAHEAPGLLRRKVSAGSGPG